MSLLCRFCSLAWMESVDAKARTAGAKDHLAALDTEAGVFLNMVRGVGSQMVVCAAGPRCSG